MKDDQIHKLFSKWQTRLKLDHWAGKLKIVNSSELDAGAGADVTYNYKYLFFTIRLARNSPEGNPVHKIDLALSIIHELIHLHLSGLDIIAGTMEHTVEEQAAQILSRVIWEGYEGTYK